MVDVEKYIPRLNPNQEQEQKRNQEQKMRCLVKFWTMSLDFITQQALFALNEK